jgi:mono/diheme cytochrome c family protein
MPQFAELSDAQLDSLRHYVRAKARESLEEHAPAATR